jgi:hypothetical protein
MRVRVRGVDPDITDFIVVEVEICPKNNFRHGETIPLKTDFRI